MDGMENWSLRSWLKKYFDLNQDKEDERTTVEMLRADVVFKGPRIWILMCAILICSIGLNMNSTAVIIGAMLISPLMGPIIGLGLGLGITDFELVRNSLRNFGFAVVISILTSALYFWITPISTAQSELLARTQPTTYDLLIALFGGFAGLIAGATKSKGQVIPGVAIATALMPPLCTAGYGIGTGQLRFLGGALYLFIINAVFIGLATLIAVRILDFRSVSYVNKSDGRRLNRWVLFIVLCTAVPSVFLAYNMIQESYRQQKIQEFVKKELAWDNSYVLNYNYEHGDSIGLITVTMLGQKIDDEELKALQDKLADYNVKNTALVLNQGFDKALGDELRHSIMSDINNSSSSTLTQYLRLQNDSLRIQLDTQKSFYNKASVISREVGQLFDKISSTEIGVMYKFATDSICTDTIPCIRLNTKSSLSKEEERIIRNWLGIRYKDPEVVFVKKK